ncbi:MAG: hypothetical protein JWQ18_2611 [Conexibacter sp.]|nr:hypothetical protein [Conexibacter sp.]
MRVKPLLLTGALVLTVALVALVVLDLIAPDLHTGVHGVLSDVSDRIGRLSALDAALLVVAAAVLTWAVLVLEAVTQVGPVEIATFTHDDAGTAAPQVEALTSLLRERLAHSGLSPAPAVPGGAPKTDLISAVAASDVPQVAWVAALMNALPRPQVTRYTVRTTIVRVPGTRDTPVRAPRLRYWLQAEGGGTPHFSTVTAASDAKAVDRAVAEIFAHISTDAIHVFPAWARWYDIDGLMAYLKGLRLLDRNEVVRARAQFARAEALEPTNALPRLQVANLEELGAPKLDEVRDQIAQRASALRRYLDLGLERSELVEPRYRGGVLAAMLASTLRQTPPRLYDQAPIARMLGITRLPQDRPEDVTRKLVFTLEQLAARESSATLALLRRWYVAVARQRVRYRYEPRGDERGRLLQTVRISRHCMAVRTSISGPDLWLRRLSLRVYHLWLRRIWCGWQAFYNAGCFYAVIAARASSTKGFDDAHARRMRRRAYRCLNRALEESGGRLPVEWMSEDDPDLAGLRPVLGPEDETRRAADPEWWLLLRRARRGSADESAPPPDTVVAVGFPARPWVFQRALAIASNVLAACVLAGVVVWLADVKPAVWAIATVGAAAATVVWIMIRRGDRAFREVRFDGTPG